MFGNSAGQSDDVDNIRRVATTYKVNSNLCIAMHVSVAKQGDRSLLRFEVDGCPVFCPPLLFRHLGLTDVFHFMQSLWFVMLELSYLQTFTFTFVHSDADPEGGGDLPMDGLWSFLPLTNVFWWTSIYDKHLNEKHSLTLEKHWNPFFHFRSVGKGETPTHSLPHRRLRCLGLGASNITLHYIEII